MPRKKKEFRLSEEELEELDGHVHDCTLRISPEGHRPIAFCNSLVFWVAKKPLKWKSHKADYEDRSREHRCREWTPEEDQKILEERRLVAISRGGNVDNFISYEDSTRLRKKIEKKRERKERKARGEFIKKKPESEIFKNGKPVNAVIRKSRKEHNCQECDTSIVVQEMYLSLHEERGSEYSPFRICLKCSTNQGYELPEGKVLSASSAD